jgi:hypothetical protein
MRRALGPTLDLVTAIALAGLALGLGCSHEARPAVAPEEHAPLPPASGSPVGYLVDDAGELKLSDGQLARLRQIDDELGTKLAASETALRTPDPVATGNRSDAPRGLGFRAGGGRATVDDHAMPLVQPVRGGATGFPSENAQPRQYVISGATLDGVYRIPTPARPPAASPAPGRTAATSLRSSLPSRSAIGSTGGRRVGGQPRPLAQRTIARRVLTEHGVDPDTGQTTGGEPGARPDGGDLAPLKPAEP